MCARNLVTLSHRTQLKYVASVDSCPQILNTIPHFLLPSRILELLTHVTVHQVSDFVGSHSIVIWSLWEVLLSQALQASSSAGKQELIQQERAPGGVRQAEGNRRKAWLLFTSTCWHLRAWKNHH